MTLGHTYKSRRENKDQQQRDIQSVITFLKGGVEREKIVNFIKKYLVGGDNGED